MIIYSSSPHNGFNLKTAGRTTDVCEGGGTGRRARLRCVWFILGGSNPLLRTMTKTRMNAENSVFMRVFLCFVRLQILADSNGYLRLLHSRSRQNMVTHFSRPR